MTNAASAGRAEPAEQPALDGLRGLAVLFMVVNHAVLTLYTPTLLAQGPLPALVHLSSLAPVLFFFATGWGMGLAGDRAGARALGPVLVKAGVLVLADQLLAWARGTPGRLDFFAFIGLSMLLLALLQRLPRWRLVVAALLVTVVGARYGLVPLIKPWLDTQPLWAHLLGHGAPAWNAYPPLPWLGFALMGALFGAHPASRKGLSMAWAVAAALGAVATAAMVARGMTMFRWGTMSLAFWVFACTVVASLLFALGRWRSHHWKHPLVQRWLRVRGGASYLVVPVHLLLLAALGPALQAWLGRAEADAAPGAPLGVALALGLVVLAIWAVSVPAAQALNGAMESMARSTPALHRPAAPWVLALLLVALCGGWGSTTPDGAGPWRPGEVLGLVCQAAAWLIVLASVPRRVAAAGIAARPA